MIRLIVFIGIVQSILFLGHWFFYRTLIRFFEPANPSVVLMLKIVMTLLSISFVAASLLAFSSSNLFVRFFYTGAASWVGILYLLILAAGLAWLLYGLGKLFHVSLDPTALLGVLIGIALLASLYGFMNAATTRITRIGVEIPGLPAHWKGKTAVWISDLHLGHVRNDAFSRKIAAMVEDSHPDILFIGGDLYDGVAVERDRAIKPFSRNSVPYGTYFITGNHEEFSDKTPYLQAVRRAGMRVLDNERVDVDGLQIIGVDYRDSRSGERFKEILEKIGMDRHRPSILLMHSPHHVEISKQKGISLQLSGHTHQGQVFLFRFITSQVYGGYDYGLKREGDFVIYTSSGAGTWGPPMRIDTNPEIVVIEFR
jgi:hypothetical protein